MNDDNIWFQWNLLQGKIKTPTYLSEYSFIDENKDENKDKRLPNKYDKMLKMGVPREAGDRQKRLDGYNIPPPPPPPPPSFPPPFPPMHPGAPPNNNTTNIPKINASDLRNVVLKKGKHIPKKKIKNNNNFEPPTKEELQTTLSRLRPTK